MTRTTERPTAPDRDARPRSQTPPAAHEERGELLARISDWLDLPLAVLALVMLGLLVLELAADLSPAWASRVAQTQTAIWVVFVAAFAVELLVAPSKLDYLRRNWLTAISVALPALRAVRLLRAARALRGLSLVRILTTVNRSTRALGHVVRRGQLGYVLAITVLVTVTAAAGAYFFDRGEPTATIRTPGDALWWAATMVTTISSPLELVTLEGRIISLLLRAFALAVSGYLTAIIAVYLLGGNAAEQQAADRTAGRDELRQLRTQVARLERLLERHAGEHDRSADRAPAHDASTDDGDAQGDPTMRASPHRARTE